MIEQQLDTLWVVIGYSQMQWCIPLTIQHILCMSTAMDTQAL